MPNLTSVGVTAGVPTSGTGTVSTIDNMVTLFPTLAAVTATGNAMDINVKSGGNPNGSALSSASAPVVIASDQGAVSTKGSLAIASTTSGQTGNLTMGAVTTAAPSYTTAQTDPLSLTTAGALRMDLSSIAGTATPVGSGVMATAPRVTLATDSPGIVTVGTAGSASTQVLTIQGIASGTVVPVSGTVSVKNNSSVTGTQTSVASSATDVTILASNVNRLGATVFNDSTQILYLLLASGTSSNTNYTVQLTTLTYYEVPFGYTGVIKGLWASANGNARVTELT